MSSEIGPRAIVPTDRCDPDVPAMIGALTLGAAIGEALLRLWRLF